MIQGNHFANNYAGKKGTALLVDSVSELVVQHNVFENNGPVTSQTEIAYSPYYEYLANSHHTISYFPDSSCTDEFQYFAQCQSEFKHLEMNQVKGALYIKGCHDDFTCFWPTVQDPDTEIDVGVDTEKVYNMTHFILEYSVTAPWQNATVWNNTFENNQANVVLSDQQTQA